jgi:hypothetical protein
MYKKIIKVKLSPRLNVLKFLNFVLRNLSDKSSVEVKNVDYCTRDEKAEASIASFPCSEYPGHYPEEDDIKKYWESWESLINNKG